MTEEATTAVQSTAETINKLVERAATGIELLAVAIIVAVIAAATGFYLIRFLIGRANSTTYTAYRHQVARALLLGLEILVAADVIRTVALEPSMKNILVLGILVVIRTFLGWSLVVEIEERWPWQAPRPEFATGQHEGVSAEHETKGVAPVPVTADRASVGRAV